jgi:(2Fe-2S) ferredoxin
VLNVYITDLSAYNKGVLHGDWYTLPMDREELQRIIAKVLKGGEEIASAEMGYNDKHEEYFISDYEWESIELFDIGEYENLDQLNSKLQKLENHSKEIQLKAIAFLLSEGIVTDFDEAIEKSENVTVHEDISLSDLAHIRMEELYQVEKLPSIIATNIDYDKVGRELELDNVFYCIDNDIYEYNE